MSSLSGRHMSRGKPRTTTRLTYTLTSRADDYYQSANFVADSLGLGEQREEQRGVDDDEDMLLPGDYGGQGVGLAGGYPGSQLPPPTAAAARADAHPHINAPNPYPAPAPAPALAGAGDDLYAGYDPGMAGCTIEQGTCHIPGVPHVGAEHAHAHAFAHTHAHVHARGYERDADEYTEGTSVSASPSSSSSSAPDTRASVAAPAPAGPNTNSGGSATRPERRPSIGTRLVGRVERLAGKVLRDPDIEARGKRHMVRPPFLCARTHAKRRFDSDIGLDGPPLITRTCSPFRRKKHT